ncbi:hypothetical protein [Desulfitobacterium hafniense]|uniref:hypothetical protein n=1 Tax=Desulfitobacterium hafniense TaxID=49338 RepID=UPI001AEC6C5E|nr:hypothetical protein [Desulfitobacterium hafniense]
MTSKKTKKEADPKAKGTTLIYVGPQNRLVARYTIYKNGYPGHLKSYLEECKALINLFISPEKLAEFEQKVAQKGTLEHTWFQEARKYFSKAVSN